MKSKKMLPCIVRGKVGEDRREGEEKK
jgi:hypothetical protein